MHVQEINRENDRTAGEDRTGEKKGGFHPRINEKKYFLFKNQAACGEPKNIPESIFITFPPVAFWLQ